MSRTLSKCNADEQSLFYFLLVSLFILFKPGESAAQQTKSSSQPNIIFILADDLGYGDLELLWAAIDTKHRIWMPWQRQGLRFTQFYAGTAVCAPSRSSLLTGQHTGHTPIRE